MGHMTHRLRDLKQLKQTNSLTCRRIHIALSFYMKGHKIVYMYSGTLSKVKGSSLINSSSINRPPSSRQRFIRWSDLWGFVAQ